MPVEYTYYHLYNRGCNKEPVFFKDDHYLFLLRKIKNSCPKYNLRIIAYCLMPNHYHLMVGAPFEELEEPSEGFRSAIISKFIQKVFNSYVQAVNFEMKRKGTLFESKYKSIRIDKEEYLLQLVRYIHLNPVLAGLCAQPEDWEYSNCKEWLGIRQGILFDRDFFDTFFQTFDQYREFLYAYKDYKMMQKGMRKYGFDF